MKKSNQNPPQASLKNLERGVGKGRTLRHIWREQGLPEEEVERRYQARLDLIKASRARGMARRAEMKAHSFGLGEAVSIAHTIDKTKKALSREFKLSPLKGTRHQTTLLKDQQRRQKANNLKRERAYNPKVRGLQGVEGLTLDEDGSIGLEQLRQQRPDILQMRPMPVNGKTSGRAEKINELMLARGRKDPYYDKRTRSKSSSPVPTQAPPEFP